MHFDIVDLGASPVAQLMRNLPANAKDARDVGSVPGSDRSAGERNGNLLQYSCRGNSKDRGAWRASVYRLVESDTTEHMHIHTADFKIYMLCILFWLYFYYQIGLWPRKSHISASQFCNILDLLVFTWK